MKFRAGQVSCALWENQVNVNGQMVMMLKATVERRYKDKSGVWKSSGSFSRNEIPLVQWCLDQAFTAMIKQSGQQTEEQQIQRDAAIDVSSRIPNMQANTLSHGRMAGDALQPNL